MAFLPDNLSKLIKRSGILHKENKISFIFNCPLCSKKDKLYIRKSDGRFRCFACITTINFQGKPEYALKHLLSSSVGDIQKELYDDVEQSSELYIDLTIGDFDEDLIKVEYEPLIELHYPYNFYSLDHSFSEKGRNYLIKRGLDIESCKEFDIRYCPQEQRVVFPIKNNNSIYGWQKRTVLDNPDVPKVLNSTQLPKNRTLMFIDSIKGFDYVVLAEGPVDALKALKFCKSTVCTMGKQITDGQVNLLLNNGIKKIYLALDPDAYVEKNEFCKKWNNHFELYSMEATKKDLGEMSYEEVYRSFKTSPRVESHYIFSYFKG